MLNFDEIPKVSWKGNVFYQISSFIKKNNNDSGNSVYSFMKQQPLKIYRREIANINAKCNERISLTIDEINRPGFMIESSQENSNGLVNIITNNITECVSKNKNSCINMPDMDARRRVRSAGMTRRNFNVARNNDTYYTSSNQYLVSRNRTFSQNQYNYIRQGNASVKPGSVLSKTNVYSPNGISHCVQAMISNDLSNNYFQYTWLDGSIHNVNLPAGQYDIFQLNKFFQNVMIDNTHYILKKTNNSYNYLLNISYDDYKKQVVLQIEPDKGKYNNSEYELPLYRDWELDDIGTLSFIIPPTNIQELIGFTTGTYNQTTQNSNMRPKITQNYTTMNYKPNNPQFGQQGAVSSSSLIARKKYDIITSVGSKMNGPYGSATASAYAYGVSDHQYTIKDKIGYPNINTPVISKYTGEIKCCK